MKIEVIPQRLLDEYTGKKYKITKRARKFIYDYDNGNKTKPSTFIFTEIGDR